MNNKHQQITQANVSQLSPLHSQNREPDSCPPGSVQAAGRVFQLHHRLTHEKRPRWDFVPLESWTNKRDFFLLSPWPPMVMSLTKQPLLPVFQICARRRMKRKQRKNTNKKLLFESAEPAVLSLFNSLRERNKKNVSETSLCDHLVTSCCQRPHTQGTFSHAVMSGLLM